MKYRIVDGKFGPYVQYFLGIGRVGKWCDVVLDLDGGFIRWPFESRKKAEEWLSFGVISGSKGGLPYSAILLSFVVAMLLSSIIDKHFRPMSPEEILVTAITVFIVLLVIFLGGFSWVWQKYASKKEVV